MMDDVDGKQCTLYGMLDKLNECVGGRGSAEPVATSAALTHARHAFTYTHTRALRSKCACAGSSRHPEICVPSARFNAKL